MITNLDVEHIHKSLLNIVDQPSTTKIMDMIFTADRMKLQKEGRAIPAYLLQFCKTCSTYNNVVPTLNQGLQCETCASKIDEKGAVNKIKGWIVILDKNKKPIKTIANLYRANVLSMALAYVGIARSKGYKIWRSDQSCVCGGYYENEAGEICRLFNKEITYGNRRRESNSQPRPQSK